MRTPLLAAFALLAATSSAFAEQHIVTMLNRGAAGAMIYEPDFVQLAPGDSVKFVNGSAGHNAATIDGMVPEGYAGFKGKLSEEIEVTFNQEGLYGIKCSPHFGMGMVMVIRVGDPALDASFTTTEVPERARERFTEILDRNGFGD